MSNDDRHEEDRAEWASRNPIIFDETNWFAVHHEPALHSDHRSGMAMDLNGRSYPVVPTVRFHSARASGKAQAMEQWLEQFSAALNIAVTDAAKALSKVMEGFQREHLDILTWDMYGHHGPPSDPKERALWLRQHRNTGPARPSAQNARRPRRHH